jgi:hypothetical protein
MKITNAHKWVFTPIFNYYRDSGEHEASGHNHCGSMTAVCRMDKDKHAWIRTTAAGSKNYFYTAKEGPQSSFMGIIVHERFLHPPNVFLCRIH